MVKKNEIRNKPKKRGIYRKATWIEFVKFTATPIIYRDEEFGFHRDGDFCKKNKINNETLCRWKNEPEFYEEVRLCWKKWGKDRTPNVIAGLYRTAVKEGKAAESLAWMKIVEDWQEKLDVGDIVARKSLKDIQDNIRRLVEQEKAKSLIKK
ncbi:hypothetical protein M0R01_04500 [bacterium]|jgi:hypothetical protein|nr:hypothetical protein [bacterium]